MGGVGVNLKNGFNRYPIPPATELRQNASNGLVGRGMVMDTGLFVISLIFGSEKEYNVEMDGFFLR